MRAATARLLVTAIAIALYATACSSSNQPSGVAPSSKPPESAYLKSELATVEAQADAHAAYVETVRSLQGSLRCGDGLSAHLAGDWPIGRAFTDGEPIEISIDYSTPGCTEVTAFLYIRCARPCAATRSLLAPGTRPLTEANGKIAVSHGTVLTSDYCDASSDWCRAGGRTGFELCALSLAFNDPWHPTEPYDLVRALEDPAYAAEYDRQDPHGRVEFGQPCFAPTASERENPVQATSVPAPRSDGNQPLQRPSALNCHAESSTVSCYDPYWGNVYCSGDGVLYCQTQRGALQCQPNGEVRDGQSLTIRC